MGCCVSTEQNKATQDQKNPSLQKHHQQQQQQFHCVSKSPPRPEEETVKEVLSETPKPKPILKSEPEPEKEPGFKIIHDEDQEEKPTKPNFVLTPKKLKPVKEKQCQLPGSPDPNPNPGPVCTTPEETSEVSEMLSISESVISSSTLDDHHWSKDTCHDNHNGNKFHHQHQRVYGNNNNGSSNNNNIKSHQGQFGHFHNPTQKNTGRVYSGGRSPVRRSDPSPQRRRNPSSGPLNRADGPVRENSGRRSRSPATRSNVGRSPSGRRTGPSPGRVRMVQGPNESRKVVDEVESVERRENEDGNESEWNGPSESLENPLVSLECFIFL